MAWEEQYRWETEGLKRERHPIRRRWIVIVILLAAVLTAFGLTVMLETEAPEEDVAIVYAISLMPKEVEVKRLEIKRRDQTAYVLTKENSNQYAVEGMDDFKLNQDMVETMMQRAGNIAAERIVDSYDANDAALSGYGLKEPWMTITVNDTQLSFGNVVPSMLSRYALRAGDDNIYTVSQASISALNRSLNDLHVVGMPSILSDERTDYIYIEMHAGETIELSRAEAEESPLLTSFFMLQPYRYPAHSYRVSRDIVPGVVQIAPYAYAGHIRLQEDAEKYGLDAPWAHIRATDNLGGRMEVSIGDEIGSSRYITVDDTGDVYLIASERLEFLQYARSDYLAEQFVSLITIDKVSQVEISADGAAMVLEIMPIGDGKYKYSVHGEALDSATGQSLYEQIISVQHDVRCPNPKNASSEELSIRFKLTDDNQYEVDYLSYNDDYLAVRVNGALHFMVKRDKLNSLMSLLEPYFSFGI